MSKNRWERTGNRPNKLSQTQRDIESERSRMIDIDGVLLCDTCGKVYLVYEEEVRNDRPVEEKPCSVTMQIAKALDVPAFVAQVHMKNLFDEDEELCGETIESIKVLEINPDNGKIVNLTEGGWQDLLMRYRDGHEGVCKNPTNLRWDETLRHDVNL